MLNSGPHVGSGAVRIGPLHFPTGGSKSHTKSGFRLFCLLGQVFPFLFCVSGVCSIVFDCFWLSVPVQLIAWKDSSPNDLLCVEWDVKPYTLTHSLTKQRHRKHLMMLTQSTASNLEQVANLLYVQANSASYPQWDGK